MSDWRKKYLDGQNVGQTRNWAGNKPWDWLEVGGLNKPKVY